MRLLLLGAFIGAAAAWYFATANARRGLSEEAADRIWHSIVDEANGVQPAEPISAIAARLVEADMDRRRVRRPD